MRSTMTVLLMALLFWGCAGEKRVTDTGFLQKRKFRPGWDLSIGKPKLDQQVGSIDRKSTPRVDPVSEPSAEKLQERFPQEELHASLHSAEEILSSAEPEEENIERSSITIEAAKNAAYVEKDPDQEDLLPKKRWNWLAIPAFVASLGIVAIGLYTTSTIWVIIAIAVTFILAGISIRQIRKREEAGKGFAIAALLIALLAVVATAIAIAVVGFV